MQNICIAGSTGTSKQDQSLRAEVTDVRREEEKICLSAGLGSKKQQQTRLFVRPNQPDQTGVISI